MPSRPSSDNQHQHHNNRNPSNFRGEFSDGGHYQRHHFGSPPNHPQGSGGGGGFRPMGGGGGFRPMGGGGDFGGRGVGNPMPLSGQKRGFPFSGRGGPPSDNTDGGGFAKLFVGSVPRTVTEEDIRPLFEEHGDVIEVALIKDKRTGQQQGCCFIKYGTSEDADRAIRALHNQYTLPGGVGPIQVRYADGERERLGNGTVEHKLFVGSMNRHATEKEIEEIFAPYGRVEDVYIMRDELKQSRGCGFVKYSHRDMAAAAMNALNGTYLMRGCDQPLTVRFADPKRPRAGDSRGAPALGGPGFGPRSEVTSGFRPAPNLGDPMGGHGPPNAWHPMSPQGMSSSPDTSTHGFGGQLVPRGVMAPVLSATSGPLGGFGGPTNGSLPALAPLPSIPQQSFNTSMSQGPPAGQQISPLQKPLQSPPHLLPPLQLQPQHTPVSSYSQTQTSQASTPQLGQQIPSSAIRPSSSQALPSQHLFGSSGLVSVSQPQVQQSASSATTQLIPLNLHQGVSATAGQQQLPVPAIQHQQLHQPLQQSPSQLAQVLSQQTQALQASFQSSQAAFSQLQQQLQMMQQSGQNLTQQPSFHPAKQQSPWTGSIQQGQTVANTLATAAAVPAPSTTSAAPAAAINMQVTAPLTCNWTEHTSPEGYKYYYNSVTSESRWEKPEELTLFEQQQQQKPPIQQLQQLQSQTQTQSHPQVLSTQQVSQTQQIHIQSQMHHQQQLQLQPSLLTSSYQKSGIVGHQNAQEVGYAQSQASAAGSGVDPARFHQQGLQVTQEWMWKNKPTGA